MYTHKFTSSSKRNKEMKSFRPSTLDKVWINHNRDENITSALRYVKTNPDGNYVVAVARAYNSMPFYCKSTGKKFAKERMKKYFKLKNFGVDTTYRVFTKEYDGYAFKMYEGLPIFIMGNETVLNPSELIFWHNEVLPNIERELRNHR